MPWFTKQTKKKARNTSKVRISAVPMSFKANFCHFRPVSAVSATGQYDPIRPNSGRISPVRRESKPIRRESSRVGTNQAESVRIQWKKKKKKLKRDTNARATTSDAGATPSQLRPCFLANILLSASFNSLGTYYWWKKKKPRSVN